MSPRTILDATEVIAYLRDRAVSLNEIAVTWEDSEYHTAEDAWGRAETLDQAANILQGEINSPSLARPEDAE